MVLLIFFRRHTIWLQSDKILNCVSSLKLSHISWCLPHGRLDLVDAYRNQIFFRDSTHMSPNTLGNQCIGRPMLPASLWLPCVTHFSISLYLCIFSRLVIIIIHLSVTHQAMALYSWCYGLAVLVHSITSWMHLIVSLSASLINISLRITILGSIPLVFRSPD